MGFIKFNKGKASIRPVQDDKETCVYCTTCGLSLPKNTLASHTCEGDHVKKKDR